MNINRFINKPEITSELINREKLFNILYENRSKQLILISAPAGYGKTSILLQYVSSLEENSYIWLQGTDLLHSPYALIKMILTALLQINFKFNFSFYHVLDALDKEIIKNESQIEEIFDQFVDIISSYNLMNFKIIIDDFQLLEYADNKNHILELLSKLTKHSINGLTIILSSREEFSLPVSKLETKRNLISIRTGELLFSDDEVLTTAKEIYNLNLNLEEIKYLRDHINGWIAALHLIFQKGKNWKTELQTVIKRDIFRYYTEDVLYDFSDDLNKFICVTSLLDSFNSTDCNMLLKVNNSDDMISLLQKKNVFIESFYDEKGRIRFCYQKLFKEYLVTHYDKIEYDTYLNIAEYFKLINDIRKYLFFILKANDIKKAIEIFQMHIISFISNNEFVLYEDCLEVLNNSNLIDHDFLLYHKSRLNLLKGLNINEYMESMKNHNSQFISDTDTKILLVEYFLLNNKYGNAISLINEVKKEELPDIFIRYINFILARVYYRMGSKYYENALKICLEDINLDISNPFRSDLYGLLGNIYKDKGNLVSAIKYYEASLVNYDNIIKHTKQTGSLVELYSMLGNYEKAFSYLNELTISLRNINVSSVNNVLLRTKFFFYDHLGDYDNAIKCLNDSINNVETQNNQILLISKYLELSSEYWYKKNYYQAKDIYGLAENIYNSYKKNEYFDLMFSYYRNYIADNSADIKVTEQSLLDVIKWHKENKIEKPLGYFMFYLSQFYLNNNDSHSSYFYLKEALKILESYGYFSFLENNFVRYRFLFDLSISQNYSKKLIVEIGLKYLNRRKLIFIDNEYSEVIDSNINELFDIKFLSFGTCEIKLRNNLVPESKWIRKKSKILLAYLMSDPQRIHTKDEIMDIFFDDMPADKADVVYHSAIYNIRTALKIYDIKSDKPKRSKDKTYDYNPQYILYEDKTLRLNPDFYYTSGNIEFEKLFHKIKLPALTNEEKITHSVKAVEMYKGDFLPGYYDSWCEELRVKYKNMYIELSEELVKLPEAEERFEEVIKYSEMLLKEDKLNDQAHVNIINAYAKLGNNNMAKSRLDIMLKIYDNELGEKPQPKTLSKINSILAEK